MSPRRKRRRPLRSKRKACVSVSVEVFRLIKIAAEVRGMSMRQLVEEACKP